MKTLYAKFVGVNEHGLNFEVSLCNGQRTTFFFKNKEKYQEWIETRKKRYSVVEC